MIRRWLAPVCALVGIALVVNCAQGSRPQLGDDDDPMHDASTQPDGRNSVTDAPPPMADAAPPPDATVLPPDAPPDAPVSQLFCTQNSECTNAGECCFTVGGAGLCVPGTVLGGICFPVQ
jgi:hypothetical protein